MKKTVFSIKAAAVLAAVILTAGTAFAEKSPHYISPNNDGVQDTLEVPLLIKEKRYISEWSFVIYDASGNVVRTIGNKEKRPDKLTFKNFFKALISPKTGVEIPHSVSWNGVLDDGSVAPDGTYYYSFSATDDNGNSATTAKLAVIVDNTPPSVDLQQPRDADKFFGEGSKAIFAIRQSGSKETKWTAQIIDAAGKSVRSYAWNEAEPLPFNWDGTNDNGVQVADGVYSYHIGATDEAGNKSAPAQIANIIYSSEKPATNIAIDGSRYFSLNKISRQNTVTFDVIIPLPESSTGNKLDAWSVSIIDAQGKVYRTYTQPGDAQQNPPQTITFDGKDDNGKQLADGQYQARVTAKYHNGYEPSPINSPVFYLDSVAPVATVSASETIFSPDGDGVKDNVVITEKTSAESEWTGSIIYTDDKTGKETVVKQYNFGSSPAEKLTWNGMDDAGNLCANGHYRYELAATDAAGNTGKAEAVSFQLDTSKTELVLSMPATAFNPKGDKNQRTMTFTPVVKTQNAITDYKLVIADEKGTAAKTFAESRSLPQKFIWDGLTDAGERAADGKYTAKLEATAANGKVAVAVTQPFTLDTVTPTVEMTVPYTLFSPDGASKKASIPFTVTKSTEETRWTGRIESTGKKTVVRTFTWQGKVPSFTWDGTDDSGNVVADGNYRLTIDAVDEAGNKSVLVANGAETAELALTVDKRETKAYVTAALDAFSPNGDGVLDAQQFAIRTSLAEGVESWKFTVTDAAGKVVNEHSSAEQKAVPEGITWNGLDKDGKPAEGTFTGSLQIVYAKGNEVAASSSPFLSSVTPPALEVATAPKYFSPDNDGVDDDLFIRLRGTDAAPLKNWSFVISDPQSGKPFWSTDGKSAITEKIIWDGYSNEPSLVKNGKAELVQSAMDYPYEFTVTDTLGMTSTVKGIIPVDVLVIRVDANRLKMQVPSIIFRSDHADFVTEGKNALDPAKAANNEKVLKRIAEILNKFKEYNVTVEGHANPTTTNPDEETVAGSWGPALIPLSQERAQFVKDRLIKYGVASDRLGISGKGGTEPVADTKNKDVNWKNRRVEFILNK